MRTFKGYNLTLLCTRMQSEGYTVFNSAKWTNGAWSVTVSKGRVNDGL